MKHFIIALMALILITPVQMEAKKKTVTLRIIQTSDVHGCFFPYDFINRKPLEGTLARVSTYVSQLRKTYGNNLILVDNGDILQGQPSCYYCNFVKTDIPNVAASVINYLRYDAQTMGNHDVETGHAVYDKWIKEVNCPMLGANIIDTALVTIEQDNTKIIQDKADTVAEAVPATDPVVPESEAEPVPPEPDNRVKAADLEKRLSLLK